MRKILDAKYKNDDINKVMEEKCQQLSFSEIKSLLNILKGFEDLFDVTQGTWNTSQVDLEFKDDAKPV